MSDHTTPSDAPPTTPQDAGYSPPQGSPLYAPALTPQEVESVMDRLNRQEREHRDRVHQMDQAWHSPEAAKIRDVVRSDGNVEWLEFVKHCGGIMAVVGMVDGYGLPDTDQIIPKVDELFDTYVQREIKAGSVFRRRPGNRPYVPGRGTSAGEAKAAAKLAGRDFGEKDVDALLRAERDQGQRSRTTAPR